MIDYRVYVPSKKDKAVLIVAMIFATAFISILFYNSIYILICTPVVYKVVYKPFCHYKCKKRQKAFLLMFKDLLHSLGSSFSTGRGFYDALVEAKDSLINIYGSDSLIVLEINHIIKAMENSGVSELQLLEDLGKRAGQEDVYNFVGLYKACIESGGDLISSVARGAEIIGEKINTENDIDVLISQKKIEGRIITAMPIGIIVFLRTTSPGYLDIMYGTFGGRLLMTLALIGMGVSYWMVERITAIEV